tara:strand:+ start:194 stop:847 length:654 start_codon:yes stop_codon:yes gene_type:complete
MATPHAPLVALAANEVLRQMALQDPDAVAAVLSKTSSGRRAMRQRFLGEMNQTKALAHNDLVHFMRGDFVDEVKSHMVIFGNLPVIERCRLRHHLLAMKEVGVMGDGSWRVTVNELDDVEPCEDGLLEFIKDNIADIREAFPEMDEEYDFEKTYYDVDWDTFLLETVKTGMVEHLSPDLFHDAIFSGNYDVCGTEEPRKRPRYSRAIAVTVLIDTCV